MRILACFGLYLMGTGFSCPPEVLANAAEPQSKKPPKTAVPAPPKTGIKTPGIQVPVADLKAETEIPVTTPGSITVGDVIFVTSRSMDQVARIEFAKPNETKTGEPKPASEPLKALDPIDGLSKPCSGTVVAFGTLWVPNCGTQTVTRYDTKTNKLTATLGIGAGDMTIGLVSTADSVWMFTDNKSTLSRIDPIENKVVAELRLPASCNSVAFAELSLWVTCPAENKVFRIDPATNLVIKRIDVSPGPRSVAFGAGSIWVLCETEGKIERIDPRTNKVIRTIELMVPAAGGGIAFGEGYLWATQLGFPITRIETTAEKERVAQQFWGEGGGIIAVSSKAIWLVDPVKGLVQKIDPKRIIATLPE
jgi:virginiamycin B lyase